ncbi:sporulation YhaL family protein [Oceanobacillus sp. FSL H7-0719]|uniref:sporulation YhaL family protein n=1 Tax=Oceanobacillus sp. FSL H7-0719 TaxID=2954507 RepID=UPI003247090D
MIIGGIPLWVFIIILLILFSGYMAFRAIQADRKLDQQYIEQEGQIYIDRMSKEKQEKAMRRSEEDV